MSWAVCGDGQPDRDRGAVATGLPSPRRRHRDAAGDRGARRGLNHWSRASPGLGPDSAARPANRCDPKRDHSMISTGALGNSSCVAKGIGSRGPPAHRCRSGDSRIPAGRPPTHRSGPQCVHPVSGTAPAVVSSAVKHAAGRARVCAGAKTTPYCDRDDSVIFCRHRDDRTPGSAPPPTSAVTAQQQAPDIPRKPLTMPTSAAGSPPSPNHSIHAATSSIHRGMEGLGLQIVRA